MKKTILSILISATLSTNLFAMEYEDSNLASWRDGFITAYKALKLDTKLQGVQSKPIPTEKYIIYFDANKSDISDWDKVMVQMFGYSLSLNKPIRSIDGFIIFDSFDNKATAIQELELLNKKLFKGSEKYSLTLLENTNNKVFYSDTAILMTELDGLKKLLENVNKIELNNKKKELENNQKVALVYVDEKTDKILNINEDIVETDLKTNKKTIVTSKDLPKNKKGFTAKSFFGTPLKESISVYKKPVAAAVNKTHEIFKDEVVEFDGLNGQGWYKLKNEEAYIPKQFIKIIPAPKNNTTSLKNIENKIADKTKAKAETPIITKNSSISQEAVENKDSKIKEISQQFIITEDQVIIYKLKNFTPEKNIYGLDDFSIEKTIKNDGSRKEYSHIVTDIDGNKFIKLKNQNAFIDLKNAHLIK